LKLFEYYCLFVKFQTIKERSDEKIHDSIEELPSRLPDARDCVRTNYNTSGSAALTMVPEPAEGPKKNEIVLMFLKSVLNGFIVLRPEEK